MRLVQAIPSLCSPAKDLRCKPDKPRVAFISQCEPIKSWGCNRLLILEERARNTRKDRGLLPAEKNWHLKRVVMD